MTSSAWPVALERDVLRRSLVRGRLSDANLVVWRGDDDVIRVWEDRCPHRSVRFSAGRNLGDCIEDFYHGWRFGRDGALVSMPAGDDLPAVRARVLESAVENGFVWVSCRDGIAPDVLAKSDGEIIVRPMPVASPAAAVGCAIAALPDARLIASPTGETASIVFGIAERRGRETEIEAAWRTNLALRALRRRLEAGSQP